MMLRYLLVCLIGLVAWPSSAVADDIEDEIERAKSKQDRQIKSFQRVKDKRGLELYAEQERNRAEQRSTPIQNWLAGRALHFAGKRSKAHGYLVRSYEKEPRMWPAALRLSLMYLEEGKDLRSAKYYVDRVLRTKPNFEPGLMLLLQVLLMEERWAEAIDPLHRLYRVRPESPQIWSAYADCYLRMNDFEQAIVWLDKLRSTKLGQADPTLKARLAECYLQLKRWDAADAMYRDLQDTQLWSASTDLHKRYIWVLMQIGDEGRLLIEVGKYVARVPEDTDMVSLLKELELQQALRAKDPEAAKKAARELLRTLADPDARARVEKLIQDIEAGQEAARRPAPQMQQPDRSEFENHPLIKLMRRCINPVVEIRRKGLQEYYQANIPLVDPVVYQRFSEEVEPDPECRIWVLRILGRFTMDTMAEPEYAREVAKRLAVALEDSDSDCRRVAAEGLGDLKVPGGLIYLLPHLSRINLDVDTNDRDAVSRAEGEYNAVRQTLRKMTKHIDRTAIQAPWVPLSEAAENRAGWEAWLDTDAATPSKLAAIKDLRALKMAGQEPQRAAWLLRYCLDHCFRPSRWEVVRAAYSLLRDRRQPAAEGAYGTLWKSFPVFADALLVESTRDNLESNLRAWWRAVSSGSGGRAGNAVQPPPKPPVGQAATTTDKK